MNKKILSNIYLSIFVIVMAGILIIAVVREKNRPAGDLALYVRPDCPHCEQVKNYIAQNNINEKINLDIKDTDSSIQNYNELMLRSTNCGLDLTTVGVPLLYESGVCYVGEEEILNYFSDLSI